MESANPKIVVVGSCSVDFTTYTPRLPKPGETLHGTKFTTSFGGKGANQCVAAAKLGGNTYMVARVGDDYWGKQYIDNLIKFGINVTYTKTTKEVGTGIAQISVGTNGDNQIVIVPGANDKLSTSDINEAQEVIKHADILISQLETPFETTYEAFKLCDGIRLLNAAPAYTNIEDILKYCHILCVNEPEASVLVGFDVEMSNIKTALRKLLDFGCKTAIITLGGNGAAYCERRDDKQDEQCIHVHCTKVVALDTTGAGDAFVGALANFLVSNRNKPLHQIVGAACEIATKSVTKEGTQSSFPDIYNPFKGDFMYVIL